MENAALVGSVVRDTEGDTILIKERGQCGGMSGIADVEELVLFGLLASFSDLGTEAQREVPGMALDSPYHSVDVEDRSAALAFQSRARCLNEKDVPVVLLIMPGKEVAGIDSLNGKPRDRKSSRCEGEHAGGLVVLCGSLVEREAELAETGADGEGFGVLEDRIVGNGSWIEPLEKTHCDIPRFKDAELRYSKIVPAPPEGAICDPLRVCSEAGQLAALLLFSFVGLFLDGLRASSKAWISAACCWLSESTLMA